MIVVSGVSLALADESTVDSEEADLRVVPPDHSSLTAVVDAEPPRMSGVHDRAETIESHDQVTDATPVLLSRVRLRAPDSGQPVGVLAIGVEPGPKSPTVAGLSTSSLGEGDPRYANGSYDGKYTGDVVLSAAAAEQLNASACDPLLLQSGTTGPVDEEFSVVAIEDGSRTSSGFPIAVFRLSELQEMSGAAEGDLANQILVRTSGDGGAVQRDLESMDENTTVVTDGGVVSNVRSLQGNTLAMGLSVTATLVGVVLCTLLIATTMGLAVNADRQQLAVLATIGYGRRAQLVVVTVTILGLVVVGATVGLVFGAFGTMFTNTVAQVTVTDTPIATLGPWVIPYALGVAILAGVFAAPYPLAIAARTSIIEELNR
jgi:putative ABC transport system permease protein